MKGLLLDMVEKKEKEKELKVEEVIQPSEIIEVEMNKSNLELLKESYEVLRKEYDLPEFENMNKDFQIEKIQEEDTELLIREIRKYVSDKFSTYLRFIETLLQPTNAQMFVFSMLKTFEAEDTEKLKKNYKKLAQKEIDIIELDLDFNLDKEIIFIKSAFDLWQKVKAELLEIISTVKKGWNDNSDVKDRSQNYFG